MSILIYFLLGAFTFFAILTIIGFLSPKVAHVERAVRIELPQAEIFDALLDFRTFQEWNPWSKKDPNINQWIEGELKSVGSKYAWKGNKSVGMGHMQITLIEPNSKIEMNLNFGPQGNAKCGFLLEPIGDEVNVIWYFDSNMGRNPLKRLIGRMMDKFIGNDFYQGLQNLKDYLSKK